MKKILPKLALTVFLISSSTTPTLATGASFSDIDNSYAKDAILQLVEAGIINGKSEGKFDPAGKITRQEFSVILAKALNLNVSNPPAQATFSDVPTSHWSYSYVEAAAKAGLINGIGDGTFGSGQVLSRQQMATLFVRALGVDATGYADRLTFSDTDSIASYAKDAVAYVVEAGLMNGYPNNTFNPTGVADRQAVASVTSKFLKVQEDVGPKPETEPVPNPKPTPTPNTEPQPVPSPTPDRDRDDNDNDRPRNHAPTVSKELDNMVGIVGDIKIADISNAFTDADEDKLEISFTVSDQSVASITMDGALNIKFLKEGTATVTLTAKDSKGKVAIQDFTVTVKKNHVPMVISHEGNFTLTQGNEPLEIDLSEYFSDEDGDRLSYTASLSQLYDSLIEETEIVSLQINGKMLTITPLLVGSTNINVKAKDGRGGEATTSFSLVVHPARPAAPNFAINFSTEQLSTSIPSTIEYTTDPTWETGIHTGTGDSINVTPGTDLYFRVKASDNLPAGEVQHLVVKDRPSIGEITVSDQESDATILLNGIPLTTEDGYLFTLDGDEWNSITTDLTLNLNTFSTLKVKKAATSNEFSSLPSQNLITNSAPTVINPISDKEAVAGFEDITIDISDTFIDLDGDILELTAESNDEGIATVSVIGTNIIVTPAAEGTVDITVNASDGKSGNPTSHTFSITVSSLITIDPSTNTSINVKVEFGKELYFMIYTVSNVTTYTPPSEFIPYEEFTINTTGVSEGSMLGLQLYRNGTAFAWYSLTFNGEIWEISVAD